MLPLVRVTGSICPLQPTSPGVSGRCPEELWQWPCSHHFLPPHTDVVPAPPDGPPTVASVTGRAITLTWNKPKWLDTAIGEGVEDGQGWAILCWGAQACLMLGTLH